MPWAGDGVEVPAASLRAVPSRTWTCNGRAFKRMKAAALKPNRYCCLIPLLDPTSTAVSIWVGYTSFIDLTYTAFVVALSVAFNDSLAFSMSPLAVLDLIGSITYLIDLALGFLMGVVARWQDRAVVVRDSRTAARFYVWHSTFWIDAVATLPLFGQLALTATGTENAAIRFFFMLRLLRLFRVFRLLSRLSRSSVDGPLQFLAAAMNTRSLLLFHAVFSLCVTVNTLGCIWWNLAAEAGIEGTWATAITKGFDLTTAPNTQRWLVSCYYSLTTMVTIGYGDITPYTISEVAVTMLFEVVGVAFFGYVLNVMTSLLTASGPEAKRVEAVRQKLEEVEDVMADSQLSAMLRRNIRMYFSTSWTPPQSHGAKALLFQELPSKLRQRMLAQSALPLLRELGFFPPNATLRQQKSACKLLAAVAAPAMLAPQRPLPAAVTAADAVGGGEGGGQAGGLPQRAMLLLAEGRMRTAGGDVFSAPALLGLADLFAADAALGGAFRDGVPSWRQAGAVALSSCTLIAVDCEELCQALRQQHPALLRHLAEKVLQEQGAAAAAQQQQQHEASAVSTLPHHQQQEEQQQQQEHADVTAAPSGNGAAAAADAHGGARPDSAGADTDGGAAAAAKALRQLVAELAAAEPSSLAAAGGKVGGRSRAASQLGSSPSTWDELLVEEDAELEAVEVAPPPPLAFVWHTD